MHKGAAGPAPKWTQWLWDRNLESRVQRILRELFEEGFSPSNVIVLCESWEAVKEILILYTVCHRCLP